MHNPQRVALITGGTKGIGAATALALANDGVDVALVARRGGGHAETIRERIVSQGCRCEVIAADVASADEVNRSVDEATRLLGPIDILVHAAGGPAPLAFTCMRRFICAARSCQRCASEKAA